MLCVVLFLIKTYVKYSNKLEKNRCGNIIYKLLIVLLCFNHYYFIFIQPCYFTSNIEEEYFSDRLNCEYTYDDLIKLSDYVKKQIIFYSLKLDNDYIKIKDSEDYFKNTVINDLHNISQDYFILKGTYVDNYHKFHIFDDNLMGAIAYVNGFNVFYDKDLKLLSFENQITLAHELCHTKGIVREAEADYCSIISGLQSDNELSKLASYFEIYDVLHSILGSNIDYSEITKFCEFENNSIICDKFNGSYEKGNNFKLLKTYNLKEYNNIKEGFIDTLETLNDLYSPLFVIDKDIVTIPEIENEIDNHSEKTLKIKFSISDNEYYEFKNVLLDKQAYKDYFTIIADINYNYDVFNKDTVYINNLEYYIKPFNENDIKLFLTGNYVEEYDYDRVIRLLLDYFSKENIV